MEAVSVHALQKVFSSLTAGKQWHVCPINHTDGKATLENETAVELYIWMLFHLNIFFLHFITKTMLITSYFCVIYTKMWQVSKKKVFS